MFWAWVFHAALGCFLTVQIAIEAAGADTSRHRAAAANILASIAILAGGSAAMLLFHLTEDAGRAEAGPYIWVGFAYASLAALLPVMLRNYKAWRGTGGARSCRSCIGAAMLLLALSGMLLLPGLAVWMPAAGMTVMIVLYAGCLKL